MDRRALKALILAMPHGADLVPLAQTLGVAVEEIIDLSANLMVGGPPEAVQEAVEAALPRIAHYPEPLPRRLRERLAERHGVSPEQVILGAGAADLILRLALALRQQTEREAVLLPQPNFNEYRRAFSVAGWQLDQAGSWDPALLSAWREEHAGLLLCHPNNPTGRCYEPAFIQAALERAESLSSLLIVDQCFLDFLPAAEARAIDFLEAAQERGSERLVLLYSMTKFFAIPGLRLGYLVVLERELAARIQSLCPPWPINALAEAAGHAALELPEAELERQRKRIQRLRQRQESLLLEINREAGRELFSEISGRANFLYFVSKIPDLELELLLGTPPIYLRQLETVPGCPPQSFRLAIREEEVQDLLQERLRAICRSFYL